MSVNQTRDPAQWNHYGAEQTVRVTRARSVGSLVALIDNRSEGYEIQGAAWQTQCITHGYDCGHDSKHVAVSWASAPEEWCDECQALAAESAA